MADIVIQGMEMPKTCCQCDLKIYDPEKRWNENGIEQIGAWVCKRTGEVIWNTQRGEYCPIVPLPEGHGRMADWISVKDRLPEKRVRVLCKCRAGIYEVLRWTGDFWHHDYRHNYMRGFVTHWMPLPEPPKEGGVACKRGLPNKREHQMQGVL